ncbi:MAG: tetratricopeptide repeat protein, partial [Candidatus Brocadiaceae bacterium]|nr:tetratricopeptide repeat protein [Candidatus Brocadiaceae bacterium]
MKKPSLNAVLFPIKSVCNVITFSACILIIACCGCGKEEKEAEKAVEFKELISATAESQVPKADEEAAPVKDKQAKPAVPEQPAQPVQPEVVKPVTVQDLYNKGVECLSQGQLKDAIEAFNRATDMDSTMVDAYKKKAIACSKLGMMNEAIISFKKVVELNP